MLSKKRRIMQREAVNVRTDIILRIFDLAQGLDTSNDHEKPMHRRLMVFAGSIANELTNQQDIVRDLFDDNSMYYEIPHIMNSVLSAFKSYDNNDEIKSVWKSWR